MPAADPLSAKAKELDSPAYDCDAVTPSDVAELAFVTRGVAIGTGGVLHVVTADGNERTTKILPPGQYALRLRQIFAAGTTAAEITALW